MTDISGFFKSCFKPYTYQELLLTEWLFLLGSDIIKTGERDNFENELMTKWEHEHDMARMEIIIKRLWILVIIVFLALIVTNGAWLYYESQWEVVEETTTEETVTQDVRSHGNSDTVVAGTGDALTSGKSSNT